MSEGGTTKERLARLEVLLSNHIHHHETRDRWMMRILSALVVGVVLLATPGFLRWLGEVLV